MKKSDRQLGMDRDITRRDFIHDTLLASLGLTLPAGALAESVSDEPELASGYYPPTRTGMRGSHPGAFEAPHEIARQPFGNITIANSDAGANAYTHVAIDEAWRPVGDLS